MRIGTQLVLVLPLLALSVTAVAEPPLDMRPPPECDHPAVVELDYEIVEGKHKPIVAGTEVEQVWAFTVKSTGPKGEMIVAQGITLRVSVPDWVTVVEVEGGAIERKGQLLADIGELFSGGQHGMRVRVKLVPPTPDEHLEDFHARVFYQEPVTRCSRPIGLKNHIFPGASWP